MTAPSRFSDSVYDRIATYLPATRRESFFRYVAHLKTLAPDDDLMVLAEGMALFSCIARDVPLALVEERKTLLAQFGDVCSRFEKSAESGTTDIRAMFMAHQKLLDQNMGAWQNREQTTVRALEEVASNFERTVAVQNALLVATVEKVDAATQEHRKKSDHVGRLLTFVNWHNLVWPSLAFTLLGAITGGGIVYFLR